MRVIFPAKLINFTYFYDQLLKNLYDRNFTFNLVKKMMQNYRENTVILPGKNFTIFLHLFANFMQIYLFLLYRSAILDPLFWISELQI